MKHFLKLSENAAVMPILSSLARHPELWNQDKTRTTFENTPHADVSDILLRFGSKDGDDLEAVDLPASKVLIGVKQMALDTMKLVNGSRLGRIVITKLEPGKKILPHSDVMGLYTQYYTRYHLVLQGLPGSQFSCGDETVNMRTGELWWFDAHAEHSVDNNSHDDRIHMLIDVRIDD